MSRAADRYADCAQILDDHLATYPSCSTGTACSDGDAFADAEYRSWRELQQDDSTTAHHHHGRKGRIR